MIARSLLDRLRRRFGSARAEVEVRMWADYGVEFYIHPAMQASPENGFPEFFDKTAMVNLAA